MLSFVLIFQPIRKSGVPRQYETYREKGIVTAAAAPPLTSSIELILGAGRDFLA
jgi:hypothetical protein